MDWVGDVEPVGQRYPAMHSPVHADDVRPKEEPYLPAGTCTCTYPGEASAHNTAIRACNTRVKQHSDTTVVTIGTGLRPPDAELARQADERCKTMIARTARTTISCDEKGRACTTVDR